MRERLFRALGDPPRGLRIVAPRGLSRGKVARQGGEFGAGLITGVSLVTRGEALGHSLWLDSTFIDQVHEAGLAAANGLKARFAHPGLSSDGIGSVLGRWQNFRKTGSKQVYADLHLAQAAHESPDGDLADYVMRLAEEAPEMFAASIVFEGDKMAEETFAAENVDEGGRFVSPDRENRANLRHARLSRLYGADMVDEPAANPGGLFSAGNALPAEAEGLLDYALGLSETAPEAALGVDPERARRFLAGYLARRGVTVVAAAAEDAPAAEYVSIEQFNQLHGELGALGRKVADLRDYVLCGKSKKGGN